MIQTYQPEAGPSNYATRSGNHSFRAPSQTSQPGPQRPQSRPSSPATTSQHRPTHVQAIHDFSPMRMTSGTIAAHPNLYLTFTAGEIIRVYSRDASGWWDGEIGAVTVDGSAASNAAREGPRRGWFPSNYVREMGWEGSSHRQNNASARVESSTNTHLSTHKTSQSTSAVSPSQTPVQTHSHSNSQPVTGGNQYEHPQFDDQHPITSYETRSQSPISQPRSQLQTHTQSQSQSRPPLHARSDSNVINSSHTRQTSAHSTVSHVSSTQSQSRSSTPSFAPSPKHRSTSTLAPDLQHLLRPVVQYLLLLENAIQNDNKRHLQPATAEIITAIRSALTQTNCLSKDSDVLRIHPALAKGRKVLLMDLSRLVAAAKTASNPPESGVEKTTEEDDRDMELLARCARSVFAETKRFLLLANEFGVEVTDLTDITRKALKLDHALSTVKPDSKKASAAAGPESVPMGQSTTNTSSGSGNSRMQETFRMKAKSIGDLRAAKKRASSPPPPLPTTAGLALTSSQSSLRSRARSPSNASTPMSATFASSSGSGRSSPMSFKSTRDRRVKGSIDSTSTNSYSPATEFGSKPWSDSTPMPTPPSAVINRQLSTASDVHEALTVAEDGLLSIIAAFIGHIHSHHIASHPSSHQNMVEMTQEAIECVRELLTIVEAIGSVPAVKISRPKEVEQLCAAKNNLYQIASRLVEITEELVNAPYHEIEEDGFEKMKGQLLSTATATLRSGTECVRLVKLCIPDSDESSIANNATPRQSDNINRQNTPRPPPGHESGPQLRDRTVGQRGIHTLSGLHRKASSLSLLKSKLQEGSVLSAPAEDESGSTEDDEELVADTNKDEDLTMRPVASGPKPFPVPPVRPLLLHTNTSPALGQAGPKSAELLRSFSEDMTLSPMPRSRSSSLTSPAPPQRMTHRSPSRSADLDKFTADYDLPVVPRRPHQTRSSSYLDTLPLNQISRQSVEEVSLRSSAGSDQTTPVPTTPYAFDQPLQDSPMLGDPVQPDVMSRAYGMPSRMPGLTIDTDILHGGSKRQTFLRPSAPNRANTAPLPVANSDVRFWVASHDYDPREIAFNSEGNIIGASLTVLVEKMTPHDGPVDPSFWTAFFYTFRLHTTPAQLVEAIMDRYDLRPPSAMAFGEKERALWTERKVVPVRLRVYNFLRAWLDTYWREETDDVVLDTLIAFAVDVVNATLPAMAPRLIDAIQKRSGEGGSSSGSRSIHRASMGDRLRSASNPIPPLHGGLPPTPIISKSLNTFLQKHPSSSNVSVTEFDTLELARQLTVMESKLFSSVAPEQLLQTGRKALPELKALSTLSNQITGWISDNILNELDSKKRASLLKFYIKLADKCFLLNNFSTLFAVLAGLQSSPVLRLEKTWNTLSAKYRVMFQRLQGFIEHSKNHATYRARLREVDGPCLPFLGLILTDITFTSEGNSDVRPSVLAPDLQLINQDKYNKLGKIAIDFVRYQKPFNFHELEVVQLFLRRVLAERGSTSIDALYRKSLMLEPRQDREKLSATVERPGWLGGKI